MLPAIRDLRIVRSNAGQVVLIWSSPGPIMDWSPQPPVIDYDIRFVRGKKTFTNKDWSKAVRVRFRSAFGDNRTFKSEDPKSTAYLEEKNNPGTGQVSLSIDYGKPYGGYRRITVYDPPPARLPKAEQHMYREPRSGSFAVRYKRQGIAHWSPISNFAFNRVTLPPHRLLVGIGNWGISNGPATIGYMSVRIWSARGGAWTDYSVYPVGLSTGARIGFTYGGRTAFVPRRHLCHDDFDGMGINLLSQGVAVGVGLGRSEMMIFESARDAVRMNRRSGKYDVSRLVAGPIRSAGFQYGIEANLVSIVVGRLSRNSGTPKR